MLCCYFSAIDSTIVTLVQAMSRRPGRFDTATGGQDLEDVRTSAARDLARKCAVETEVENIEALAIEFGKKIGVSVPVESKSSSTKMATKR